MHIVPENIQKRTDSKRRKKLKDAKFVVVDVIIAIRKRILLIKRAFAE